MESEKESPFKTLEISSMLFMMAEFTTLITRLFQFSTYNIQGKSKELIVKFLIQQTLGKTNNNITIL